MDLLSIDSPPSRRTWWATLGLDSLYVLLGFPLAIASFTVLVTGMSLSAGLIVIWFGFPLAVATLYAARLFATIERARLDARGTGEVRGVYRRNSDDADWVRRLLAVFKDPQSWLDLLHGVLILPMATVTFSIVVGWWAGGLGGVTYWLWGGSMDDDDVESLPEMLHLDISDSLFYGMAGAFLLATLVPVVWACASAQAGFGKALLANRHVDELRERSGTA